VSGPGEAQPIPRPDPAPISALLFDFGGTLDSDGIAWRQRFFRLWREEVADVPPERFDAAFYAADDALVGALPPSFTLPETAARLAAGIAGRLGSAPGASVDRVAARFAQDSFRGLAASAELLARWKDRYRLGVVSNFYGNLAAVCAESGLAEHLSVAIDSACLGCSKPDPRIFRAALEELSIPPERAIFVGDSPGRDMEGARALGMRHVRVSGGVSGVEPGACCPGDRAIARLADLEDLLP
jgi:FMN phosphatase YigB (HAD superfamily)